MMRVCVGLFAIGLALVSIVPAAAQGAPNPNPPPSCKGCPATYIPDDEFDAYLKRAIANRIIDQQVRSVDIGKSNVAIGMVHRTKISTPGEVAEHDLVSEVYHVISGSATLVTGPDIEGMERRPATNTNVRLLNGPGHNGKSIRNGVSHQLKAGDVSDLRRHRPLVHEDRRSHHLPDDSRRSRQGDAAQGRSRVESRPGRKEVTSPGRMR